MEKVISVKAPKECCSARNVLWHLVFVGFAVNYMIRLNLNIALVSMVQSKTKNVFLKGECNILDIVGQKNTSNNSSIYENLYTSEVTIINTDLHSNFTTAPEGIILNGSSANIKGITEAPILRSTSDFSETDQRYFDWNEKEQGHILGSYFWLHWVTQLPGGILAAKYGTKLVFGWSNFLGVLGSYLIPWFAHRGTLYLVFIRGLQGILCGFCWPSMHNMTAKWIPPNERSNFVTAYMGSSVGAALTYPLCGFIIDRWGWEMVFYVSGVIGTIWFLAWLVLVYDSPSEHPRISKEEKEYILVSLGETVSKKTLPTPWKSILTDRSLWTNIVAQIGGIWGLFTLTVCAPSYFKFIHGWNIRATGMLSGMPHLFRIMFAYCFSTIGDYLLRSKKMNRTNVRKLATLFCCGVQGIFMIGLAYVGCNKIAAIIFMTLAISVNGSVSTGALASLVDISPNYSAILLGICNTVISIEGFITPAVVGYFTYQNQTTHQWQKVYLVCAVLLLVSCIYYLLFSKSELASWNSPQIEQTKEPETEMMVIKTSQEDNNKENKTREKGNNDRIMYSNESIY